MIAQSKKIFVSCLAAFGLAGCAAPPSRPQENKTDKFIFEKDGCVRPADPAKPQGCLLIK